MLSFVQNIVTTLVRYATKEPGADEYCEGVRKLSEAHAQHGSFEDVLPHVFANMDVERLKICRLVSKRWNDEACRILRKRCISSPINCARNYQVGLTELLKLRYQDLPLPFKSLHVQIELEGLTYHHQIIEDILQKTNGHIKKLLAGSNGGTGRTSGLYPILAGHASTLTNLSLVNHYYCLSNGNTGLYKGSKLYLPLLDSLTFGVSKTWEVGLKSLLLMVIKGAPKLRQVIIDRSSIEDYSLRELINLPNFTNIQSLTVEFFFGKEPAEDLIRCLEHFRNLNSLSFLSSRFGYIVLSEDMTTTLLRSLGIFANSLEHLDLTSLRLDPGVMEEFPLLRNLRSLAFSELDLVRFQFLIEKLPALSKLAFYRFCLASDFTLESIKRHDVVDTIQFFNPRDFPSNSDWVLLQNMFPNCRSLNMHVSFAQNYCSTFFQRELPSAHVWNINGITLDNFFTAMDLDEIFPLLTGIEKVKWEFAVNNGMDPEQYRTNPSILNFKGLSSLSIKSYRIRNPVIELGLKRMKNLKFLRTELSDSLCVEKVCRDLQHLKEIVVTNCCNSPSGGYRKRTMMELIFAKMPAAHCGCKSTAEDSY